MNFLSVRIYRSLEQATIIQCSLADQHLHDKFFYLVSFTIAEHISQRQDVKHLQLHAARRTDLDSEGH